MNFKNARKALASMLSPESFKQAETKLKQAPISTNEFNRAVAMAWNYYEGIRISRERSRINHVVTDSHNVNTAWSRREHLSVARHLYANDGFTGGLINDMARYTVGIGLTPCSHSDSQDWSDAAEGYFEEWAYRADYMRMHHLGHLQLLWNIGEVRDGDIGIALVRDELNEPCVQTIRGHRIGTFGENSENVEDGVRLDASDRPIAYQVAIKGLDGKPSFREIPYNSFILHFESTDTDQYRGVTALHRAITHIRDKKDTIGFEKTAIKNLSTFAAVLKTANGTTPEEDWDDDSVERIEPTKLTLAAMQSGQIPVIGKDEELKDFKSDRPSPAFMGFLDFLIREICYGLGVPFEFVWNPERIGGANTRFILGKSQRRFEERRENFSKRVMNRLWCWVIADAIAKGRLKDDPKKFIVEWQAPADLTVDAGRDGKNDREDVLMGLTPESDIYAMRGQRRRQKRNQIEREACDLIERAKRIQKAYNVPFDLAMSLLRQTTPNGPAVTVDSNSGQQGSQGVNQDQKPNKKEPNQ